MPARPDSYRERTMVFRWQRLGFTTAQAGSLAAVELHLPPLAWTWRELRTLLWLRRLADAGRIGGERDGW